MNNKFFRCIAAMMAFMMLFANVALADGEEPYTFEETSTEDAEFKENNIDDKLEMVEIDGKTLYKYVFKVPKSDWYEIQAANYDLGTGARAEYFGNGQPIYTGFFNIYINDGTTTPIEKSYEGGIGDNIFGTTDNILLMELSADTEYCFYFTEDQKADYWLDLKYRTASRTEDSAYYFKHEMVREDEDTIHEKYEEILDEADDDSGFETISKILAGFFILIGKAANLCFRVALGQTLTIDQIVFNSYEEIRLDFFTKTADGNPVVNGSGLITSLRAPINKCYRVFSGIAVVGYMIMLVYIGIVIMLNSTSPDKKAQGKKAFMSWVTGLMILFMYPYLMRYVILLDDAIVTDIGKSNTFERDSTTIEVAGDTDGMTSDPDETINYEYNSNADYMSMIGYLAQSTKSLGVATAYLILTWQLIMMLVYYYKRAFVIAFLIMIFPFVALTYVIDKLNDGKSQALAGWTKEFVADVMVQVFHAVVYVFVVTTIYETCQGTNIDTILVMIAATFMFEGENVVKQIFGVGKTVSMGTVAQSAPKIAMVAKLATKTVAKTAVAGGKVAKGLWHAGKMPVGYHKNRKSGQSKGAALKNTLMDNSDTFRRFKTDMDMIKGVFGGGYSENPSKNMRIASLLPAKGNITQNIHDTAEAIDTINNGADTKSYADAMYNLQELLKMRRSNAMSDTEKKQFDAMMRHSKISVEQLDNINAGMINACMRSSAGVDKKRITQHLKLDVDYSFSNLSGEEKDQMVDKVFAATMYNLRSGYVDKDALQARIQKGWDDKRENLYEFGRNAKFRGTNRVDPQKLVLEMQKKARSLQSQLAAQINDYDSLSAQEKKALDEVGNSISYITLSEGNQPEKLQERLDVLKQDFGANQQVVEDFIRSQKIDIRDVQTKIDYMKRTTSEAFEARRDGLITQYEKKYGSTPLTDEEKKEMATCADYIAKLEMIESGKASMHEAAEAIQGLKSGGDISKKMLMISNLDKELEALEYMISKAMLEAQQAGISNKKDKDALKWAKANVERAESTATSPTEKSPVTSFYDIINAAKIAGGGKVGSMEDLYTNSDTDAFVSDKVESSVEAGKDFARKAFRESKKALKSDEKGFVRRIYDIANPDDDAPTINGYTQSDIIRNSYFDSAHKAKESIDLFSDTLLKPLFAFVGGTIGMALTNDGMPLGEAITGMTKGANAADTFSNTVGNFVTRDPKLQEKKKEVMGSVKERLKAENKQAYDISMARKAEKEAATLNTDLMLRLVSANLYQNSNGDEHATLSIIADNAEWMCVGEPNALGVWVPYQETYDYEILQPNITPYLFVRVKDASGNVREAKVMLNR